TLVGILFVGAMGFGRLVQNTGIATDVNTLLADLALARSEAIKRGLTVSICKSDSGSECVTESQWHDGWIIFTDANESGTRDDGESLIWASEGLSKGVTLTFRAFRAGPSLSYRPSGFTDEQNGTFRFCYTTGSAAPRAVFVFKTGRARTSKTERDGGPIACP
ncbi:MAG: GspH/FimT family protein, partial [Hyphomicrobium sp.]